MVLIELRTSIQAPVERCFDLARSIEVHRLGTEKTGEQAVGGITSGLIGQGEFVRWRARHFGVRQHLASRITAMERPRYFQDTMIEGAFRSMRHDHYFSVSDDGGTEMRDRFCFSAPLPVLGWLAERLVLERYMTKLLRERNEVIRQVAESARWAEFLPGGLHQG